ncbi:hypothetical protein DWB77_00233 [Streptomyces hundungensis]|uniref:Uncharacterized protein n=1 Tax=Streptomyces hundungensis TaxID=1077946 RepID=A0A387H378_9ACTN|nr:hypothetical protein [Streptomyces hundungensis]AYG78126.1 hypothetical protein DWB77_00233 [Streptomyces hundungensis]
MSVEGTCTLPLPSPADKFEAVFHLRRQEEGTLTAVTYGTHADRPTSDIDIDFDGGRLTEAQAIKAIKATKATKAIAKTVRLNSALYAAVDADTITGASRAGRLPVAGVSGGRRPTMECQA